MMRNGEIRIAKPQVCSGRHASPGRWLTTLHDPQPAAANGERQGSPECGKFGTADERQPTHAGTKLPGLAVSSWANAIAELEACIFGAPPRTGRPDRALWRRGRAGASRRR